VTEGNGREKEVSSSFFDLSFPKPQPGPDEMLVKVHSCGICGSDIVEWYRLPRAPLVQGHEIGGEVVETGNSLKKYKPGDRVFIAPKVLYPRTGIPH
jgi:D-arabinose 1-dehydrogenase-like Zn-dependent alcohol dehydrogenase